MLLKVLLVCSCLLVWVLFRGFSIFCIMLDDCTCLQHLETTRFKELTKLHNLPFVSALGHFFFPNFPLTSLTKISSKFLFSSSSYFKQIRQTKMTNIFKYLYQIILHVFCNSLVLKKTRELKIRPFSGNA